MNVTPLVSVIVPAYNAAAFIRETLESVLAQTYPNVEIIVVDDGSTDCTRDCVLSYGDRVRYIHQENSGGAARPRNTGIEAASGDLLTFLDADDNLAPDRIAREVEFLRQHPDVGLVFSNYRDFGDIEATDRDHFQTCPLLMRRLEKLPSQEHGMVLDPAESTELLLTENFGHSSPMVRRDVVAIVGGYDESAIPSEDFEFQYRVASACKISVVPRIGWHKRDHPSNLSSNTPRVARCKIKIRQRILDRETIPRRRRKLKRLLAGCHVDLAYYYTGRNNALALRHLVSGVILSRRPRVKLFARLVLDALGRDTHRVKVAVAGRGAAKDSLKPACRSGSPIA